MKHCINCHYLINEYVENDGENSISNTTLSSEDRKRIEQSISLYKSNNLSWINCLKKIWEIKKINELNDLKNIIFNLNSNNCIYYTNFENNIEPEAMSEKQDILSQSKINRINLLLALIAIIISVLSLILNLN